MKAERRHELQHNQLADWLGELIARASEYSQVILASIAGVVVLSGVMFYLSAQSARRERLAWAKYLTAIEMAVQRNSDILPLLNLADQNSKTRGGQWARLAAADIQFQLGVEQMFENRTQANLSLTSAVENYSKLRGAASEAMLQARATLGLAHCFEALNQLENARLEYDALLTRYPNNVFAAEAKQRRADLDKGSTKSFYDWFARQDVKPTSDEAGIPGHKPNFDLRSMPTEGPIFERPSSDKTPRNNPPAESAPSATLDVKDGADTKSPGQAPTTVDTKTPSDGASEAKPPDDKAPSIEPPK